VWCLLLLISGNMYVYEMADMVHHVKKRVVKIFAGDLSSCSCIYNLLVVTKVY